MIFEQSELLSKTNTKEYNMEIFVDEVLKYQKIVSKADNNKLEKRRKRYLKLIKQLLTYIRILYNKELSKNFVNYIVDEINNFSSENLRYYMNKYWNQI